MPIARKYIIEILAETPPQLCVGDHLAGGQIIALACKNDEPDIVSASWLAKHLNLSKSTITSRCQALNKGTVGKALYDREQAIALLTTKASKRGQPPKN